MEHGHTHQMLGNVVKVHSIARESHFAKTPECLRRPEIQGFWAEGYHIVWRGRLRIEACRECYWTRLVITADVVDTSRNLTSSVHWPDVLVQVVLDVPEPLSMITVEFYMRWESVLRCERCMKLSSSLCHRPVVK